jgi:hypothetical protein
MSLVGRRSGISSIIISAIVVVVFGAYAVIKHLWLQFQVFSRQARLEQDLLGQLHSEQTLAPGLELDGTGIWLANCRRRLVALRL